MTFAEERAWVLVRHGAVAVKAIGRTVKGYDTPGQLKPGRSRETVENRETLNSLLMECLAGKSGRLLGSFGLVIVVGSAPKGKLMGARRQQHALTRTPSHARPHTHAALTPRRRPAPPAG